MRFLDLIDRAVVVEEPFLHALVCLLFVLDEQVCVAVEGERPRQPVGRNRDDHDDGTAADGIPAGYGDPADLLGHQK